MAQKAQLDENLEKVIQRLADGKKEAATSRAANQLVPWMRPPVGDWDGDLQTRDALIAIHKAFNADKAKQALIDAFTKGNAGNNSDGIVLSLQIDYAAQAERAYRARNTQTFPRAISHCAGRERGHGQPAGALLGQSLDYFTRIIKQGSSGSGGAI